MSQPNNDNGQADVVKMLENAIQKGHRFVLCIEPVHGPGASRAQVSNVTDAKDLARMLARFHKAAVEDAKWPGDGT